MKRLQKLIRLNRYLQDFDIPEYPGISPIRVVAAGDATSRLSKVLGDQVLIAIPELEQDCDEDSVTDTLTLAFFVIAKISGPARTQQLQDQTFDRLLEVADAILRKLITDMTGLPCEGLAGLSMRNVKVVPEESIFGGWSGWSIEIVF